MTATGAPHTTTFQPEHREDMGNNNLAFHPDDPQTVYAGSCSESVYQSEDGDRTWESLVQGGVREHR